MTKIIKYSADGESVSDFYIEERWEYLKNSNGKYFDYSTENIFLRLRLAIASGEVSKDDYEIHFNGEKLEVNNFGAILDWPDGFCDMCTTMAEQILRKAMERRKAMGWYGKSDKPLTNSK